MRIMRSTRYFMWLNIAFELLFPVVGIVLFNSLNLFGSFFIELNVAIFISYIFYAPIVVMGNLRRFPRVWHKALVALLIPGVVILIIAWVVGQGTILNLTFSSIHFYIAVLIATGFEIIQNRRVPAVKIPPVLTGAFFSAGIFVIIYLHFVILPLFFNTTNGVSFFLLTFIWVGGIIEIFLLKFNRAGSKLYADRWYRPNAAIIVTNEKGEVLLCERSDRPGTIQTVQGGIDPGETPEQAAMRELTEEIGIWPHQYEFKASLLKTEKYDWTPDVQEKLKHTGFMGQEQYFFLVEVDSNTKFDLNFHHREFREVWWDSPERMMQLAWSKKRLGIEKALYGFRLLKK